MRDLLAHADLARYAGQFVWLELNFDDAKSHEFLEKYGAIGTPTFYIIEPRDGRVTATQTGAMSIEELRSFLDRGLARAHSDADAALARGDALLAQKPAEAVVAYREALRAAAPGGPRRELAEASLVEALQSNRQFRECAETAVSEASGMKRGSMFARTVMTGMWCLVSSKSEAWAMDEARRLEPLSREALTLPATVRDHRDELYRTLMYLALARGEQAAAAKWGDRWLAELDAIRPRSDEERTAIDIARVENIDVYSDPKRILPSLLDSERAMPGNWNASLRVAQMEQEAREYDAAAAACDRGLGRSPGPLGRSWILQTKAEALKQLGRREEARSALEAALVAARDIPLGRTRESNISRIRKALAE